jgi:Arc/MetJ-type ribon-helix-helix transcriptional regulator
MSAGAWIGLSDLMKKELAFSIIIAGTTLAGLIGFLLGSGQGEASQGRSSIDVELLRQMIREELAETRVVQNAEPRDPSTMQAAKPWSSTAGGASIQRSPSWDVPLEDLEKAIERLNRAVTAMQSHGVVPLSSQVQMAQSGRYPQKSTVIRAYCRRWENDERDEEIKRKELLFLSPTEVLERFGEPNNIELEVGSLYWEYEYMREDEDGITYGWDMYLTFTDGAVMDASCSFYDDED